MLWKTIHDLSNRAPPPTLNTSITFNNKMTTTHKHLANCFTNRFTNTVRRATHKTNRSNNRATHKIQYILSVYSLFSYRVGLPLHNILSPFLSVMDISLSISRSSVPWPLLHSSTMSFLVGQPVFCLRLYIIYSIHFFTQSSSLLLIT